MSFFFTEAKKESKPRTPAKARAKDLPLASLRRMGCDACPRHALMSRLDSPKMVPDVPRDRVDVVILTTAPSEQDDKRGEYMQDAAGRAVLAKLPSNLKLRAGRTAVVNCWDTVSGNGEARVRPGAAEIECCRSRVEAQIAELRPLVIIAVGDDPFTWATGMTGASTWRGSMFPSTIGGHTCWVYPIAYPYFAERPPKKYGIDESERELEIDLRNLSHMLVDELPQPVVVTRGYSDGVEIITGQEPDDWRRLQTALTRVAANADLGVDIETNGLSPYSANPILATIAVGTGDDVVAFAVEHPDGWPTEPRRQAVKALLAEFLLKTGPKVAHSLSMEQSWLSYKLGEQVIRVTEWEDTLLAAHTLDERPGTKSLDSQVRKAFGFFLKSLSNIDTKRILEYPIRDVLRYNGMDAKWTHRLHHHLATFLDADPKYRYEYERKLRLCPTLVLTTEKGVPVDLGYAEACREELQREIDEVKRQVRLCREVHKYEAKFGRFEPGNPDHVLRLMKDVLGRPEVCVVERGVTRYTTDEDALAKIPADEVPVASLVLRLRTVEKLNSTYIAPLLSGAMTGADGMIHSRYQSTVAVTGRLASEDPNIQNFPKRKNKKIRGTVTAPDGRCLLPCDYGQIEFRVAGMASEDEKLVEYSWTGYDVHKVWAEIMVKMDPDIRGRVEREFKVDWDEMGLKTLRQEAKNKWVFPCLFGAGLNSRAANLNLPMDVAKEMDGMFWDEFQGVKRWHERIIAGYQKNLYVETLGGRKRRGSMSVNEVINTPIQGTAADIVTAAMVALSEDSFRLDWDDIHPRINVHDDLTFIPLEDPKYLDPVIEHVTREMCRIRFPWVITPLVVEVSKGRRWHEAAEIGIYRSDVIFGDRNPYA